MDQVVQESATQSVALIHERLSNDMSRIEEIAFYLGQHDMPINSPTVLQAMQRYEGGVQSFKSITTATPDGTLYGVNGEVLGNIAVHPHFQAAMTGKTVISNVEKAVDNAENIICVTAPIQRDGETIGIVNGRFSMSSFSKFLSSESFGGAGYSYMSSASGNIFIRSENPNADQSFLNIYESFRENSSVSDKELTQMRLAMQNGEAGRIFYSWNGDKRTMNYMPVGINDWYFLSVLPNEVVTSRTMVLTQEAFMLTGALLLVVLLLIFYISTARRKNQWALEVVHEELLTIYNTIPGGVFKCYLDEHFTLAEANDGFYRFIGYSKETFLAQFSNQLVRLMQPEDILRVRQSLSQHLATGEAASDEIRFISADGSVKWILLCGNVLRDTADNPLVYCCFTDMTELKQAQERLRDAKQRYDLIMAATQEVVFEWDPLRRTIHHSKIFEEKFGYPCTLENFPESLITHHLVPTEDTALCLDLYHQVEQGAPFVSGEFRIIKADGTFLWCRVSITAILDEENRLCSAVGLIADIDHVKQELQAVTELAQRDSLTGLYNRATTEYLIAQRLQMPFACGALLTVDIDNFKDVNDTLGHASGDSALMEVSHQLKRLFRTGDIVGRVGGDEFTVFVEGLKEGNDLEEKLLAISEVFNWSFSKKDLTYS
ncbi:MAG: diguanylate cyclase, partial [Oscillibacter sp.]